MQPSACLGDPPPPPRRGDGNLVCMSTGRLDRPYPVVTTSNLHYWFLNMIFRCCEHVSTAVDLLMR